MRLLDIKELAKALGVSHNTLLTWLGHYSLAKYVKAEYIEPKRSRAKLMIHYSTGFIAAFKKYVKIKHPRVYSLPLDIYEKRFKKYVENNPL